MYGFLYVSNYSTFHITKETSRAETERLSQRKSKAKYLINSEFPSVKDYDVALYDKLYSVGNNSPRNDIIRGFGGKASDNSFHLSNFL